VTATLDGLRIPQAEDARYLGLHLDRRLNWKGHSPSENNLDFKWEKCTDYSTVSHNYRLKTSCCKTIVKPIWVYGVQLWVSNSNIKILQRFQNKYLRIIVNAPWYVINDTLHHDLNVPYVRDETRRLSQRYADRMEEHPNILTTNLTRNAKTPRRLRKRLPQDLCT